MHRENGYTARTYSVLHGFDNIIPDFQNWLAKQTGTKVHGHIFGRDRAHFSTEEKVFRGGLSDHPRLRDYNPEMFLTNLIWSGRGEHQSFQFGPHDAQDVAWMLAKDINARITVITGAWAVPLFKSGASASACRNEAAHAQRLENKFLCILRSPHAKAQINIFSLSCFIDGPRPILQNAVDVIAGHRANVLQATPSMVDLTEFGAFLQSLRNQGMPPFLTGEFPVSPVTQTQAPSKRKPYLKAGE